MNRVITTIALLCLALLAGCRGPRVEVPPGHVGKVLSPDGYEEGTRAPSSFRLPYSPPWGAPYRLVLVQASDRAAREAMQVFMPRDRLNLDFDVRLTYSVPADERVEMAYERLSSTSGSGSILSIDSDTIYQIYVQPVVRDVCRSVIAKYTIDDVLANREAVAAEMGKALKVQLKDRPIEIVNFGFGEMQPPKVLVDAQVVAKEREVAIKRAEADRVIEMTQADTRKQLAIQQQEIDMIEATTQAQVDQILAGAVSDAFIKQRALAALQALVTSDNRVIYLPSEAFHNPAIMIGAQMQQTAQGAAGGN